MRIIACLLIACAGMMAHGQQRGPTSNQPNPLDKLAFMEGDWSGKQEFNNQGGPAMVGDASDRIEECIAARYVCEMLSTTLPGGKPTDTRHFISFDKQSSKYTAWWFNDTSTHPTELTGEVAGKKLVLLSGASGPGPVLRATYESPSANTLTFLLEMKQGDNWAKLFLTTYSKKAPAQP
ncbi:MAG: DUF1579 family protein [Terracidiphilus sp.]